MGRKLSYFSRKAYLEEMSTVELDLLVIGGGITGAGIALDASQRGLKVGLVEMQDFAAGTSSRSTKLIHGGLRYLKQGDVQLVREVGRERAILYQNAPHLVTPEHMLLPIIKGGTYGRFASSIGLWIYDWLAGVERTERRKMLSKEETLQLEPLLRSEGLQGAGLYYEYRTDDARLTIEVIKTAAQFGALAVNYAKVEQFIYKEGKMVGAKISDLIHGETYTILAKKIVNATGPWVDGLRDLDQSLEGKRLHLTKGVHIVLSRKKFPLQHAIYFDHSDGRMIFAIPRGDKIYIGTTDTDYKGSLEEPEVLEEEREYLLSAVRGMFAEIKLTPKDVESEWAGLRPLIHEDGKSPSELSRKDEIFLSKSGLITIAGGKLTGFRKMAERVVDLVCKQLSQETGRSYPSCKTDQIPLSGGDLGGPIGYNQFLDEAVREGKELGLDRDEVMAILNRYGSNISNIFRRIYESSTISEDVPISELKLSHLLKAELEYTLEEEMVVKPEDFLIRRTGMLYFDRDQYEVILDDLTIYMDQYMRE